MARLAAVASLALFLSACSSIYYGTLERVGIQKREILTDRVEEARNAQVEGMKEFRSALDEYRSVIEVNGGNLEDRYDELRDEYDDSKEAADRISERIDSVEEVAGKLFTEWEEELQEYDNTALRSDSARKLERTKREYESLIRTMRNSEERLQPALDAMHDQVLYLKHNLNARAIAALDTEAEMVMRDVDALLESMREAINEADAFLASMKDDS